MHERKSITIQFFANFPIIRIDWILIGGIINWIVALISLETTPGLHYSTSGSDSEDCNSGLRVLMMAKIEISNLLRFENTFFIAFEPEMCVIFKPKTKYLLHFTYSLPRLPSGVVEVLHKECQLSLSLVILLAIGISNLLFLRALSMLSAQVRSSSCHSCLHNSFRYPGIIHSIHMTGTILAVLFQLLVRGVHF